MDHTDRMRGSRLVAYARRADPGLTVVEMPEGSVKRPEDLAEGG